MIKSMTGYGTARLASESLEVTVDIKSLNSKSLDASIRMPKNFSDKEPEIRAILNQLLERGKVNVSIEVQAVGR
ncbi:YicC/YloC family endoribonuclease [Rhodocytophaga rosea]|uniref:YicC/YloC family endoribonuclease n=1 Tax=Rhodocytophaga rosea TaxID=2704465 RepID=UPI00293BAF48|nr:YicC/YloC family endoribonuclease [Rhodocytophaga rosea]